MNKQLNLLSNITDYKYRIQFQHRGSPHVHMLAWVKDAPSFDKNNEKELQNFIYSKITCAIPEDDQDLHEIISLVQQHSHSIACRKHGDKCGFQFPRSPLN